VVKGALALVALGLHVPHRAERIFERTFQVADDASLVHALIDQQRVGGQEQVAREPDFTGGELYLRVIHLFPSTHGRVVERRRIIAAGGGAVEENFAPEWPV
jgi:hypothetical protein